MHLSESSNDEYRTEFNTIFEQMKDYNATNSEASAFTPPVSFGMDHSKDEGPTM